MSQMVLDCAIAILKRECKHVHTYSPAYESYDEYMADLRLNLDRAEKMRARWSFRLPEQKAYQKSIVSNFVVDERNPGFNLLVSSPADGYTEQDVERLRQEQKAAENKVTEEFELFKRWFNEHGWWLDGEE